MRRRLGTVALGCCVVLVAAVVRNALQLSRLESGFDHLTVGDSRSVVVREMGRPWRTGRCGAFVVQSVDGCKEEYTYANPYAPLLPEYWSVSFSADGRVIAFVRSSSP
jgi:hypothetical protein